MAESITPASPSFVNVCSFSSGNKTEFPRRGLRIHYIFVIQTPSASDLAFPSESYLEIPGQTPRNPPRVISPRLPKSEGQWMKAFQALKDNWEEKKVSLRARSLGTEAAPGDVPLSFKTRQDKQVLLTRPFPLHCFTSFHTKHIWQLSQTHNHKWDCTQTA